MRKTVLLASAIMIAAALSGCAGGRSRPDEFAVSRQRPLVIPPDYALVPPAPGAAVTQGQTVQAQTLEALFGGSQRVSQGEAATLGAAGAGQADPSIRSNVADPGTNVVDKGGVTRDIVAAPEGDGQDARAATTPR